MARPGRGRARWSLLPILVALGACGGAGLPDGDDIPGPDAATMSDGGTPEAAASALDSNAPDATTPDATIGVDADASTDAGVDGGPCPEPVPATPGQTLWATGAQGGIAVYASALGPAGTTAVVGVYRGPVTLGPFALSSALDGDGEYVAQAYVAELDRDGHYLFATPFENVNGPSGFYYDDIQEAYGAAFDGAGNVYVVGAFTGKIQFPGSPPGVLATNYPYVQGTSTFGPSFAYIVKLDPHGQHVWSRSFGSLAGGGNASAVVLEPDGDIVVGGVLGQSIDFAGDDAGDANDGLAFDFANGGERPFILKLSTTGEPLWARVLYSPSSGNVGGMAVDPAGNIFVAGSFEGTLGFVGGGADAGAVLSCGTDAGCPQTGFAVKVSPDGGFAWARSGPLVPDLPTILGGSAFDGIAVDGNGNASAIGWSYEYAIDLDAGTAIPLEAGVIVSSFDPAGAARWTLSAGHEGPGQDGIACDTVGDIFVAAQTGGNITFPDGYDAGGPPDAATTFVAKLRSDGTTAWGYSLPQSTIYAAFPMVDPCGTDLVVAGYGNGVGLESATDGGYAPPADASIVVARIAP
jgi:hypothetical protein